jgi:hypothetical protein
MYLLLNHLIENSPVEIYLWRLRGREFSRKKPYQSNSHTFTKHALTATEQMKNYITFAVLGSDDSQLETLPHRKSLIMTTYCYQELTSERSLRRSVGSKMLCTNPGRSTSVSSYFLMKGCDINCTQLNQ